MQVLIFKFRSLLTFYVFLFVCSLVLWCWIWVLACALKPLTCKYIPYYWLTPNFVLIVFVIKFSMHPITWSVIFLWKSNSFWWRRCEGKKISWCEDIWDDHSSFKMDGRPVRTGTYRLLIGWFKIKLAPKISTKYKIVMGITNNRLCGFLIIMRL